MIKRIGARENLRRLTAWSLVWTLVLSLSGVGALAQQSAAFTGSVIDPSGTPAEGFKVVFKDAVTGKTFTSGPTSASGAYTVQVPVGGKYQLTGVEAPDGTMLPVQSIPPIAVRVAGTNRLDVKFTQAPVAQQPAPKPAQPTTTQAQAPKPTTAKPATQTVSAEKKPWYKKTGGIVGIVLGAGALIALAAGGGGGGNNNPPPSPSAP